jgi:hypothetical protein
MIQAAMKAANSQPKLNKKAQHDANVAALSDRQVVWNQSLYR